MIRTVAMLVLALGCAGTTIAAEREAGTMRVVACATAARDAAQARLAGLDADLVIAPARRGSVILSRHQILDLREVELAPAARPEDRCVAVVARIAQPGIPGGIYAVGAQLASAHGSVSPADALALAGLVASLPGPVVVAGDLVPTAEKPLADVMGAATGVQRLFTTGDLPLRAAAVDTGAAIADLNLHPAIPALAVRRASL